MALKAHDLVVAYDAKAGVGAPDNQFGLITFSESKDTAVHGGARNDTRNESSAKVPTDDSDNYYETFNASLAAYAASKWAESEPAAVPAVAVGGNALVVDGWSDDDSDASDVGDTDGGAPEGDEKTARHASAAAAIHSTEIMSETDNIFESAVDDASDTIGDALVADASAMDASVFGSGTDAPADAPADADKSAESILGAALDS